jgi:diguanylate cyclase (GGDEF)-like protein/PAS domain S-box-containing protein
VTEHHQATRPDPPAEGGFFGVGPDAPEVQGPLSELAARYRILIHHLPAVFYVDGLAADGETIDVSPNVESMFGYTPDEWRTIYRTWADFVRPDDRERVTAESDRCEETGDPFRVEYHAIKADGSVVWVREEAVLVRDEAGAPRYWLGIMLDVSELRQTREDLDDATSRFSALVEQIPAIVYQDLADDSWTTAYVSPQVTKLLGVAPEDWVGDSKLWSSMLHPEDRERTISAVERGIESGEAYAVEYRMIASDGRVVWFQDTAIMLPAGPGKPATVHGVMLDVTERKDAENRLTHLAYHDLITDLPNKAMFDELLDLALARARRHDFGVAVIALDADDFKLVNDSLGHVAGDQLIAQLGARLRAATRETDLVARQGGDEFLMLISDVEIDPSETHSEAVILAAEAVVARVQRALALPFVVDGTELYLTASMGVSIFPRDANDAGSLLRNADAAMFRAKATGPGSFLLHQEDEADAVARLSLSTRLRKAVELRSWALHYQPLVDLATGDMYGVEALIRWPDPSGGLTPPGEFIPLAEEMGLIEAIGDWVVSELGRQDAEWRQAGVELEVSFNLSPRQLWTADPVRRIANLLVEGGVDPARVTIEITESTTMSDPDHVIGILGRFKDEGFRLAIDDFGTGYSSLSRLRYMPADILKIDRAFIREIHEDPQSASMVSAIVGLAANLGMTPLAEGVETDDERRFLVEHGCAVGQGFYFSRPVPADDIVAIHRRQRLRLLDGGVSQMGA